MAPFCLIGVVLISLSAGLIPLLFLAMGRIGWRWRGQSLEWSAVACMAFTIVALMKAGITLIGGDP